MLFNANKKNKEELNFINNYIDCLEDIKTSNKYGEWTVDDEIRSLEVKSNLKWLKIAIFDN